MVCLDPVGNACLVVVTATTQTCSPKFGNTTGVHASNQHSISMGTKNRTSHTAWGDSARTKYVRNGPQM